MKIYRQSAPSLVNYMYVLKANPIERATSLKVIVKLQVVAHSSEPLLYLAPVQNRVGRYLLKGADITQLSIESDFAFSFMLASHALQPSVPLLLQYNNCLAMRFLQLFQFFQLLGFQCMHLSDSLLTFDCM